MNCQTLERPSANKPPMITQGSHTLGKTKKSKTSQRLSAGNIEYDNISQENDDGVVPIQIVGFRSRSKTVGDVAGKLLIIRANNLNLFIVVFFQKPHQNDLPQYPIVKKQTLVLNLKGKMTHKQVFKLKLKHNWVELQIT